MPDQQQPKAKGVVDIVFLMDATGSMAPCIDALKRNVELFIDSLTISSGNNVSPVRDWRAKVVGYRDFEDSDAEPFVDSSFVREPAALKAQLAALVAKGGGDEPESLLDAIYRVSMVGQTEKGATADDPSKWRYRSAAARVVIVFTDAPFKEKLALPEAKGGGLNDVINAVTSNRIILSVFAPDLECFNKLAEIDRAEYMPVPLNGKTAQDALKEFTADQANFKETLKQLAASVSKSAETPAL